MTQAIPPSSGIDLIVGLGNPGPAYENTRHNAGAWLIESIAQRENIVLRDTAKLHGRYGKWIHASRECHVVIPNTFMNQTGRCVQAILNYYKLTPQQLLIAHDDIDLPVGEIRLKYGGGHGGHNGLRDIIQALNTPQFYRLRIGVGRPPHAEDVADYVLHPPKKTERHTINHAIEKAEAVLPWLLNGNIQKAMQILHTQLPNPSSSEPL